MGTEQQDAPAVPEVTPRTRTRAGIGFSESINSRQAGVQAAQAAVAAADCDECDLVLLFATGRHDPEALLEGVRSVVGSRPRLLGGSAPGVITSAASGYGGHQVGVAVLASEAARFELFFRPELPAGEDETGRALAREIAPRLTEHSSVVLLYDLVARQLSDGVELRAAHRLLQGMKEVFGTWPPLAGFGLIGDSAFTPPAEFLDGRVERNAAMALVIQGGLRMDSTIMHGFRPSSGYHRVTRADGSTILELDGEPALQRIRRLIGGESSAWEDFPTLIMLGVNRGEKFGDFREEDYVICAGMALDRERGGLIVSGYPPAVGTDVQLMRPSMDFEYIKERCTSLLERLQGRRPVLALYIDCAGRQGVVCGTEEEDADEVRAILSPHMPVIGLYSGCELALVGTDVQVLGFTGVLCILSEDADPSCSTDPVPR